MVLDVVPLHRVSAYPAFSGYVPFRISRDQAMSRAGVIAEHEATERGWEPMVYSIVQKFGGSSVATLQRLRNVADIVADTHRSMPRIAVVVSAQGDTTDELLRQASRVNPAPAARETDQLMVTGECASAALLAMALHARGVPAVSLTGAQAGIQAIGPHGAGMIEAIDTTRIRRLLDEGTVAVVAGFQGVSREGDILTLGRGGSDTTAVALAAELGAFRCEIYTDVAGVCTADPRIVGETRVLRSVPADVLAEMAFAGARVLHSRAVELAVMRRIELHVRSSFTRDPGTVVRPERSGDMLETRGVITAITHDLDVARVLVKATRAHRDPGAELLNLLGREYVPVDLVARSGAYEDEFRMGFTIRRSDLDRVLPQLHETTESFGGEVRIDTDVAKVSMVGMGLLNRPLYTARLLAALAAEGITTSWVSISQARTSVIVSRERLLEAVALLHKEFADEFTLDCANEMTSA